MFIQYSIYTVFETLEMMQLFTFTIQAPVTSEEAVLSYVSPLMKSMNAYDCIGEIQ